MKKTLTILSFIFLMSTLPAQKPMTEGQQINVIFYKETFEKKFEKELEIAVSMWLKELFQLINAPYKSQIMHVNSESELMKLYDESKLDMLVITSIEYLKIRERIPLSPTYVAAHDNKVLYKYVILANRDEAKEFSPINFHSKTFISSNNWGLMAEFWLNYLINSKNNSKTIDLSKYLVTVKDESQAVLSLFFGKGDYCVVREDVFDLVCDLNPQIKTKLKIVAESPNLLHSFFCVSDKTTPEKIELQDKILFHGSGQVRLNQIINLFKFNNLKPYRKEYIEETEKIFNELSEKKTIGRN